jgi:uncharacterized DUF497 family protein
MHTYLTFDWDPKKAARNLRIHKVSFEEAASAFADTLRSSAPDTDHSWDEDRFVMTGQSTKGRILFIVYTETDSSVRLIGARVATATERAQYEEVS